MMKPPPEPAPAAATEKKADATAKKTDATAEKAEAEKGPLTPVEVLELAKKVLPPKECLMSQWSTWSECHYRLPDELNAYVRERHRTVIGRPSYHDQSNCGTTKEREACYHMGTGFDMLGTDIRDLD